MEPELSQAVIITGFLVIFFRFRINGDSNKNAIVRTDKNLKIISILTWGLVSSLFSLFLKYRIITAPIAPITTINKKTNQYFIANEIKLLIFNEGVNSGSSS